MIRAENVTVSYNGQPVAEDINLTLTCCRVTAVARPSG